MLERRSQPDDGGPTDFVPFVIKLKEQVQRWRSDALGLLFPIRCAGCERVDVVLCSDCRADFEPLAAPYCVRCGRTWVNHQMEEEGGLCWHCQQRESDLVASRSIFRFEGRLRAAIHELKFRQRPEAVRFLADDMRRVLWENYPESMSWPLDVIVAVPLHPDRERQRGYNQARLLAEPLAAAWGILLADDLLWRKRDTRPQVGLDSEQRLENVSDAFEASSAVVGLNVLLVDDVRTTGATLGACAHELLWAGAQAVYAVTLAEAV